MPTNVPAHNVKGEQLRGLSVFIADIRACKSREAEKKRINKELANIRSKFKGDKQLDGYQKKKYVCKLLFIFLLGNDVDFGHMEAVNLLSSIRYSEKYIGYLFISVMLQDTNDLMKLIIQSIRNDLISSNPLHVSTAMQCIANIAGPEMADAFHNDIMRLLTAGSSPEGVKQNAALCLLRMIRKKKSVIDHRDWSQKLLSLINHQHLGVATSACSLIVELAQDNPSMYTGAIRLAAERLRKLGSSTSLDSPDYVYYFVPAPWLSVKLLQLLQCFPNNQDTTSDIVLTEALEFILDSAKEAPKSKKVQYSNARNAVLFESINLIIHRDCDTNLLVRAANLLGTFLCHRETNLRYLAMETLSRLAVSEVSHVAVRKHQDTVILALKVERDLSVRQRAVDLLYTMCDKTNAEKIVSEMLQYLEKADYSIREELVLKVAILAEKYAVDYTWYVDSILKLIRIAGDHVSEEVWFRVIQIVINREDVQGYAAKTVFEALQQPACHENMVKVGGYILGEFGNLIAGDERSGPMVQFRLLHDKYHFCSSSTRNLLLSSYIKLINLFPETKAEIQKVLKSDSNLRSSDVEIQQRSIEYLRLSEVASADVLATVLEEMPAYPERESSLLAKLKKKKGDLAVHSKQPRSIRSSASATSTASISSATPSAANGSPATASPLAVVADPSALYSQVHKPPKQPAQVDSLVTFEEPAPAPVASQPSSIDPLNDLFGPSSFEPPQSTPSFAAGPGPLAPGSEEALEQFVCVSSGVLYENDTIQIGIKAEFHNHLGRLGVFFGNKTSQALQGLTSTVHCPGDLQQDLDLQSDVVSSTLEAGAQVQQLIKAECISDFSAQPLIDLRFTCAGAPQQVTLQLPLFVSKFMEETAMSSADFFSRWKALGNPDQEKQEVFTAKDTLDREVSKTKLLRFGVSVLEGIDPNPENFVSAGIVQTRNAKIGVLVRLEPNMASKMYRLTVRTSKPAVTQTIFQLLLRQF